MSDPYDIAQQIVQATNGAIVPMVPQQNGYTNIQNCWGFVAQAVGWVKGRQWLLDTAMNDFLSARTVRVPPEKVRAGDIAVYRAERELLHTALVVDPKRVLHKPGTWPISVDGVEYDFYLDLGAKITYRRVLP